MLPKYLLILPLVFIFQIAFSQQKRELHIEINNVSAGAKDTLWLTLSAGTSLGIRQGTKGNAVRVFNKLKDRDYNVLNMVTVVSATANTSRAFLLLPIDASAETFLLIGDQVGFRDLEIPNGKNDVELFRKLAGFNIIFINSNKDPIFTQKEVLTSPDINSQQILKSLLTDIHESAQWLEDMSDKPASWTTPQTGGRFKGLGVLKAMSKATLLDVETFMHFVNEFPGKYLGNKWKINETFATWVINNTPMPNSQSFVFDVFSKTPRTELSSWIKLNSWYVDSSFKAALDDAIGTHFVSGNAEGIKDLLDRTDVLLQIVSDKEFEANMLIYRGRLVTLQKGKDGNTEARAIYTQAINTNKNSANAYWYRGNIYSDEDENALAIKDFTKVNELVPGFASAWGNTGWLLLKQYRVKEAEPFVRKAFALEPSSTAWNINLGHYFLFTGKQDSARKYYQRTLENMSTASELTESLLADFDLFLKSGLFQDVLTKEKEWMQNEFAGTYKHYLQADSFYNAATELKNSGEFTKAAAVYLKSRTSELNARIQRKVNVHNMATWVGYVLTKDKQYAEAEKYYKEALTMARKELPNSVANDLELINELYTAWDKRSLAESYKAEATALKQKMEEDTKEKNLFIVTIGVDKYKDVTYQGASADAKRVAEEFKSKGKGFNNVYSYVLTNQQASSDSIDATMQRIFSLAGDWDTFIFYFTGKGITKNGVSYIVPYNFTAFDDDSLLKSKTISAGLLRSWSNNIAARHQFYLVDASTSLFPTSFAAQPGRLNSSGQKDLSIISATFPRMENETSGTSLLADAVLKLLTDANPASDKVVTSKRIENYISENITRNNYFLGIETFSQGRDFILANHNTSAAPVTTRAVTREVAAGMPLKRGAGDDEEAMQSDRSIGKRYALVIATDKYKDPKWKKLSNPVKDAKALENELQSNYGFETDHLYDPTYTQIYAKLDEYTRKKFDKNDQLIILFSGHGYYDPRRNEGYLVPSDAQYTELEYERYYMSFSTIVSNLKTVKAKHMLVLMDACHGGALVDKALMKDLGKDLYARLEKEDRIAAHLSRPNRLIITSGRKDQEVYDGVDGSNSPFMASILKALRLEEVQKTGILSYHLLMKTITESQKTDAAEGRFGAEDNSLFMLEFQPNRVKMGADPSKFGTK